MKIFETYDIDQENKATNSSKVSLNDIIKISMDDLNNQLFKTCNSSGENKYIQIKRKLIEDSSEKA